eukprot:jgi/Hompol1/773/HPOL_002571-RA
MRGNALNANAALLAANAEMMYVQTASPNHMSSFKAAFTIDNRAINLVSRKICYFAMIAIVGLIYIASNHRSRRFHLLTLVN